MNKNKKYIRIKIKGIKPFVFAFVCILFSVNSFTQTITTKANRDSILIGEPIELTVEISGVKEFNPINFIVGDSLGKSFEILSLVKVDSNQNSGKQIVIITSFELGNQFIAPIGIFEDGKKVISSPIPIFISLVNADTTKPILDIKPIVYDPLTFMDKVKIFFNWAKSYWYILIGILLFLGILIWFFFFRKKKEEKIIIEPKKPIIAAHILAFGKLKELEDKKLWQNDNQKQYNVELTEVIQEYISGRYNVPTAEKTTDEILSSLRFIEMGDVNKNNLNKLLMLSDLVKFAKEKPTALENEQVLKDAFDFIKTTKQEGK